MQVHALYDGKNTGAHVFLRRAFNDSVGNDSLSTAPLTVYETVAQYQKGEALRKALGEVEGLTAQEKKDIGLHDSSIRRLRRDFAKAAPNLGWKMFRAKNPEIFAVLPTRRAAWQAPVIAVFSNAAAARELARAEPWLGRDVKSFTLHDSFAAYRTFVLKEGEADRRAAVLEKLSPETLQRLPEIKIN